MGCEGRRTLGGVERAEREGIVQRGRGVCR